MKKNEFTYNTDISALDLALDPELLVKKVEQAKIYCSKCHAPFKFSFTSKYIRGECGCITLLFYPKRKDRGFAHLMTFFISKSFLEAVSKASGETEIRKFVRDENAGRRKDK